MYIGALAECAFLAPLDSAQHAQGSSAELVLQVCIKATYELSPDRPTLVVTLSVNSDVAVPKFQSNGAARDHLSSTSLQMESKKWECSIGFAEFVGELGVGRIRIVTDKAVVISGAIEDGPIASERFVGTGTWPTS
jgi:hypothetical protein